MYTDTYIYIYIYIYTHTQQLHLLTAGSTPVAPRAGKHVIIHNIISHYSISYHGTLPYYCYTTNNNNHYHYHYHFYYYYIMLRRWQ